MTCILSGPLAHRLADDLAESRGDAEVATAAHDDLAVGLLTGELAPDLVAYCDDMRGPMARALRRAVNSARDEGEDVAFCFASDLRSLLDAYDRATGL